MEIEMGSRRKKSIGINNSSGFSAGDRWDMSPWTVVSENYDLLVDSLSGTDHSWTASTLKLCAALEEADRLVLSANSNSAQLLEKIKQLQSILKRGDAAVLKAMEAVRAAEEA
ncbi:hypothetical protein KSP40_PGU007582 [Platanthera guangdongensis]|uniref:Uncharacterized protein n=1 Tax=Platanthera guangdongensis TaxID=2320717 RepID=A0ABR2LHE5_9ASPA